MSGNPSWMNNPYTFPGVPSLTPIHLKRRSESNPAHSKSTITSPNQTLVASSTRSTHRPSTAGSAFTSSGVSGSSGALAAAKVKHPYTVLKRGKRHHAYAVEVAPYPLNYEPRILDCEAIDNYLNPSSTSERVSPSLQPHIRLSEPSTHPKRVLDVGCGSGQWIVNAASLWPNATFVGIDLVAVQPDPFALDRINRTVAREKEERSRRKQAEQAMESGLQSPGLDNDDRATLRSTDSGSRRPRPSISSSNSGNSYSARIPAGSIYSRIKWVHHNFLTKQLPFKDEEFDFVHIRGIAQGVPEDQWDFLLSDIVRVLCPKGSLEIIEEDIIFPTVMAPTLSFNVSGHGSHGIGRPKNIAAARKAALTSVHAQHALNKQSLFYSEENRPSAFLSNQSPSSHHPGGSPTGFSPTSPHAYDSSPSPLEMSAPSPNNATIYGIPASYLQYAQTVPALAMSLPPLALVNPFLHQHQKNLQAANPGGTTPFAQDHAVLEQLFLAVFNRRWINVQPTAMLGSVLGMQVSLGGVIASECLDICRPGHGHSPPLESASGKRRNSEWSKRGERRRGSGGSKTLLDENTDQVDDDMRRKSESGEAVESSSSDEEAHSDDEEEGHQHATAAPPSPPLTPKALSHPDPSDVNAGDSALSKKKKRTSVRWARNRSKSNPKPEEEEHDESIDWKKFPSLALSAELRSLFPTLDNETTQAWHLQRAWESVVACKEAMWEEFLFDSANRDKEAAQAVQNSIAQQMGGGPASSGGFVGAMGSLSGLGGMGGIGVASGGLPSLPPHIAASMGIPINRGMRQAATLLDELEWADSDMRRSERERFDILLDRYEMRIRRYCAKSYESSSIPCLLARDRKAWAAAEAELYSSDEEFDYGEPLSEPVQDINQGPFNTHADSPSPPVGGTDSGSTTSNIPPVPAPWTSTRPSRTIVDDHEGHSSADEATLAEPQSPNSPLGPNAGRQSFSQPAPFAPVIETPSAKDQQHSSTSPDSAQPESQTNLRVPVPVLTRLRTGAMLKMGQPAPEPRPFSSSASVVSKSSNSSRTEKAPRRRRASSIGHGRSKEDIALPSRVFRAFIATKAQAT